MVYVRSLSVQSKLIGAFVLLTLVTIGVVSWIGYVSARQSLRAASERELMGLQRSKTALVQNILKSARNEVLSLSASGATTHASRELLAAYRQLAREPVSSEMQTEVRRFYKEEFVPALTKRAAIDPPEDSLLPTTPTGGTSTTTTSQQGRGHASEIATIEAGEFCGETGMHGHQAADMRAVALEDTVAVLIAPDVVRHLFEGSPRLARETGHTLEVHRKALQSARTAIRQR